MVEVPDYSFISKDTGPSLSQSIGAWQGITKNALEIQDKQAEQAIGGILQQSTDAQGNVDYGKANALASQAGPAVRMRMQTMLTGNAARQQAQFSLNAAVNDRINGAVSAVLQIQDPNQMHDELIRQAGRLIDSGMPRDRVMSTLTNLSNDPATLRQQLETIRQQTLPPDQATSMIYGHPITVQQGGAVTGGAQNVRGGAISTSGQPVMMTLTPAEQTAITEIPDPRRTLPDGSPNPDYAKPKPFTRTQQLEMAGFTVLPNGQVVPSAQAGPGQGGGLGTGRYNLPPSLYNSNAPPPQNAPPPPAPGAPAAPSIQMGGPPPAPPGVNSIAPYTGGGIGSVLAPAAPGPRSEAAPPVNTNVAAIMQGMQMARANPLGGSAMTAGPGAPTTPTTAATPESGWGAAPGTYGTGPTPAARPTPIPTPAQRPATSPFDRPAVGLSPAEQEQAKGAGARFDAETTAGTNAQGQHAILGNMLADTAQFTTGPLAGVVGKIRNFAGNLGLNINTEAQSAKESFNKLAAGLANAQGAGSDARMNVNISANPHEELSPAGVDFILRQLQGNADYLQARQRLAQQWPAKSDYNGFADSVRQLDPRVFQYERLQPDQKTSWFKAMDKRDQTAFMAAHGWAENKGLIPSR